MAGVTQGGGVQDDDDDGEDDDELRYANVNRPFLPYE
jgi:hypothetical protein